MNELTSVDDPVFDEPTRWRLEAVRSLGLSGDELCAGISTSLAMPAILLPAAEMLDGVPEGPVVDLGGGLGSTADWIRRRTERSVLVVEPSAPSCEMAGQLFEDVGVINGTAGALPLRAASVAAVVLNGVTSLIDDLDHVLVDIGHVVIQRRCRGHRRRRRGVAVALSADLEERVAHDQ